MFTCYHCGKGVKGTVKHTGVVSAARATGWDYETSKPRDMDFPKAMHPTCYAKAEALAAKELS